MSKRTANNAKHTTRENANEKKSSSGKTEIEIRNTNDEVKGWYGRGNTKNEEKKMNIERFNVFTS